MRGEYGTITLIRTRSGWSARFAGQVAETIRIAFGTTTIPTAFASETNPSEVLRDISAKWKDCAVVVEGVE